MPAIWITKQGNILGTLTFSEDSIEAVPQSTIFPQDALSRDELLQLGDRIRPDVDNGVPGGEVDGFCWMPSQWRPSTSAT